MKILILANSDVGLFKFRKELIQELIDQGIQVCISLPNGEFIQPLTEMGCEFIETKIDRRGMNPVRDLGILRNYYKILKSFKPDLVLTYTIKPNIYGGIVSRIKKIPYAINITGIGSAFQKENILKKLIVTMYKVSCKSSKVIFFENDENRTIFIKNKIASEKKCISLKGAGVNLEEYEISDYPQDDSEVRFLFIGRIMREKGVEELFGAAKRIKKEFPKASFSIVGPLEENYESIINQLQDKGIIKYYGYQSEVTTHIKSAHCFVLPSYHEGMANTLLECGASGRPLITSNTFGCKEAVIDGETGYLVSVKNTEDLYRKLQKFIRTPFEKKRRMGINSRLHIEKNFNRKEIVSKTIFEILR